MRKSILPLLIAVFLTTKSTMASAEEFSSAEVAGQTMNMDCVNYCVVGVCYYLLCTPFGCDIDTTARISHYLPDLFVTVMDEPMENPWEDYREVMGNAEEAAEKGIIGEMSGMELSGGDFTPPEAQPDSSIKYKDVSVVGHPLALITQESISDYVCETEVTPWMPYFSSTFDYVGWRMGMPDRFTAAALIPGRREIGSRTTSNLLGNTWGSVYPRFGKLLQHDDARAAAVMAQRAVDIVTREKQPHVYLPISGSSERNFDTEQFQGSDGSSNSNDTDFSSDGLSTGADTEEDQGPLFTDQSTENNEGSESTIGGENGSQGASNEQTDKWQMFSPKNDDQCEPFGNNDSTWTQGRTDESHQYAWNYWRRYECCVPGKGVYIGHTNFKPICTSQD